MALNIDGQLTGPEIDRLCPAGQTGGSRLLRSAATSAQSLQRRAVPRVTRPRVADVARGRRTVSAGDSAGRGITSSPLSQRPRYTPDTAALTSITC